MQLQMGSAVVSTAPVGVPPTRWQPSHWRARCSARRRTERPGRSRSPFPTASFRKTASSNQGTNMVLTKLIATTAFGALLLAGCEKNSQNGSGSPAKVRVGYIGLTCEAPIFTAVEKGFFKEEGLDVSLVKCDWKNYKDVLALGGYDVTHHLVMYFLKPVEQGLDVKFTGGIHRGCLRVQIGRASCREWGWMPCGTAVLQD